MKKKQIPLRDRATRGERAVEEDALGKKKEGDAAFESGDIEASILRYSEGIQLLSDAPPSRTKASDHRPRQSSKSANMPSKESAALNLSCSFGSSSSTSITEPSLQKCASSLYGNRAAAYYMLFDFEKSLEDALKGYQLDPSRLKLLHRAAFAALSMGDIPKATLLLERTPPHERSEPNNNGGGGGLLFEDYQRCVRGLKVWKEKVVKYPDTPSSDAGYKQLQKLFPECPIFSMMWAKSAVQRLQYTRAVEIMQNVGERSRFPAFHALLSECLYYTGCDALPGAISAIERAIHSLPTLASATKADYEKFQKKLQCVLLNKLEADNAYKKKDFLTAVACYTKGIEQATDSKGILRILYCNRAAAYKELSEFQKSIDDCTKALEQDPSFAKAYARRGRCHMAIADYAGAMLDFKKAMLYDNQSTAYRQEYALAASKLSCHINAARRASAFSTSDIRRDQQEGVGEGKKWNDSPPSASFPHSAREEKARKHGEPIRGDPNDFYAVLGVSENAASTEIRKKYRELSLQLHPDKCTHLPPEEKLLAEQKFKAINEAYSTLVDPEKRSMYHLNKRGIGRRRRFAASSMSHAFGYTDFGGGSQSFRDPNATQYKTRAGDKGWW